MRQAVDGVIREAPAGARGCGVGAGSSWLARRAVVWLRVAVLLLGAFIFAIPLLWMLSTSLKTVTDVFRYPPDLIPRSFRFQNYVDALSAGSLAPASMGMFTFGTGGLPMLVRWTLNTLLVASAVVVGAVISNPTVAFGFARLRFVGRDVAFFGMLATMMLPGQVTIIPVFEMFNSWGWVGTYMPLTVPAFFGSAWLTFLFRQYIMMIPLELDDAARIDGCSTFGIFRRVILPLSRPMVVTTALFAFADVWNDFFDPLIYLQNIGLWTISIGLASFTDLLTSVNPMKYTSYELLMAASLIVCVPMMVIFYFLQGTFVRSVVLSGLKA